MKQIDRIRNMDADEFIDFLMEHTTPDICTFCKEDICVSEECLQDDYTYGKACKKVIKQYLESEVDAE